jgi:hypothetical protein
MTRKDRKEKRDAQAGKAFRERTETHFGAFRACYNLMTERANKAAANLVAKDNDRWRIRSFAWLAERGFVARMATQIHKHTGWLAQDSGQWLAALGVDHLVVQEILFKVAKRKALEERGEGKLVIWPIWKKWQKKNRPPQL